MIKEISHNQFKKKYSGKMKVKRVSKFSKSGNTDIFPIGRKP